MLSAYDLLKSDEYKDLVDNDKVGGNLADEFTF